MKHERKLPQALVIIPGGPEFIGVVSAIVHARPLGEAYIHNDKIHSAAVLPPYVEVSGVVDGVEVQVQVPPQWVEVE